VPAVVLVVLQGSSVADRSARAAAGGNKAALAGSRQLGGGIIAYIKECAWDGSRHGQMEGDRSAGIHSARGGGTTNMLPAAATSNRARCCRR